MGAKNESDGFLILFPSGFSGVCAASAETFAHTESPYEGCWACLEQNWVLQVSLRVRWLKRRAPSLQKCTLYLTL